MFAVNRIVSTIIQSYPRNITATLPYSALLNRLLPKPQQFSTILNVKSINPATPQLLKNAKIAETSNNIIRTVTKFSLKKGKRKTVKAVIRRFYRLNWGGWIRTKAGCHKHLWMKKKNRKIRLQHHVFCNAQKSLMLDKMVNRYWKKPKYYVDDPYEPYHNREWFLSTYTKPKPYFPPENNS